MISSSSALQIVLDHTLVYDLETVNILQSIDRVLAEDIIADRDFPPFDRVMMDGIAIHFDSYAEGRRSFKIEKTIAAGDPKYTLLDRTQCIEIMTGASLPIHCDTVIPYEHLVEVEGIFSIEQPVTKGQNIHQKGRDHARDEILLHKGSKLKAIDINILATVGKSEVVVRKYPNIAVISSGDELVSIDDLPLAHQIRRSNSFMIQSALAQLGMESSAFHISDHKEDIQKELKKILDTHEVLILSGGVSKGKFDFIPDTLENLGVEKRFHRIAQRPGKPFWFGTSDHNVVFAFPGNPVSTLLCYLKYFVPWHNKNLGLNYDINPKVRLAHDFSFKPALTYFAQASIRHTVDGVIEASIYQGNGSGDIVNPSQVDGFIELPHDEEIFKKGSLFSFIPFKN